MSVGCSRRTTSKRAASPMIVTHQMTCVANITPRGRTVPLRDDPSIVSRRRDPRMDAAACKRLKRRPASVDRIHPETETILPDAEERCPIPRERRFQTPQVGSPKRNKADAQPFGQRDHGMVRAEPDAGKALRAHIEDERCRKRERNIGALESRSFFDGSRSDFGAAGSAEVAGAGYFFDRIRNVPLEQKLLLRACKVHAERAAYAVAVKSVRESV